MKYVKHDFFLFICQVLFTYYINKKERPPNDPQVLRRRVSVPTPEKKFHKVLYIEELKHYFLYLYIYSQEIGHDVFGSILRTQT